MKSDELRVGLREQEKFAVLFKRVNGESDWRLGLREHLISFRLCAKKATLNYIKISLIKVHITITEIHS